MSDGTHYFKRYAYGKFVACWEAPDEWTESVRDAVRAAVEIVIVRRDDGLRRSLERAGVPGDTIARVLETLRFMDDAMVVDRPYS